MSAEKATPTTPAIVVRDVTLRRARAFARVFLKEAVKQEAIGAAWLAAAVQVRPEDGNADWTPGPGELLADKNEDAIQRAMFKIVEPMLACAFLAVAGDHFAAEIRAGRAIDERTFEALKTLDATTTDQDAPITKRFARRMLGVIGRPAEGAES